MIITGVSTSGHVFAVDWLHDYWLPVLVTVSTGLFLGSVAWVARFITHRISRWLHQLDDNDKRLADSLAAARRVNKQNHKENVQRLEDHSRQVAKELAAIKQRLADVEEIVNGNPNSDT